MSYSIPRSTLEQWSVLQTVVKCGNFADAAHILSRSQSSVSYAISKLQDNLGVTIMEVQGRRAVLTQTGKVLLAEILPVLEDMRRIEARAAEIAGKAERDLRIVVDSLFPKPLLMQAISQVIARYPETRIDLREVERTYASALEDQRFDLAICLPDPRRMEGRPLYEVLMAPVARPDHPLAQAKGALRHNDLVRYLRVIVRERDNERPEPPVTEGRIWYVSGVESAIEAVRQGVCFGWLPLHKVQVELAAKRLIALETEVDHRRYVRLDLMLGNVDHPPVEAKALSDLLYEGVKALTD
ncbi:LysR family transcriptional regulator [Thioclava kandeliae]|uniref:LysR family transcriptional regulator n=1 Tax=Thioclava kandeliae TaxID=3070818 RepID=A0ABV1SEH6_9RHOB